MSRLKGFAAYEGMDPVPISASALQLLCKEHCKIRRELDDILKLSLIIEKKKCQQLISSWLDRGIKLKDEWSKHILKEEAALLSSLAKYVDSDKGPLAVMRFEHEQMHKEINRTVEAMQQLVEHQEPTAWNRAMDHLTTLYELSGQHCRKEETVIFSTVENMLTSREKQRLLRHMKLFQ